VAFGLVYSAVFITEMLPKGNVIRRGFIEGTEAAMDSRRKAQTLREAAKAGPAPKGMNHTTAKKPKTSSRVKKAVGKRAAQFDAAAAEA
jgi:hypothetical protein